MGYQYCRLTNGDVIVNNSHVLATCIVPGMTMNADGSVKKDGSNVTSDTVFQGQCVAPSYVDAATRTPLINNPSTTMQQLLDAKIYSPINAQCTMRYNSQTKQSLVDPISDPPSGIMSATAKPNLPATTLSTIEQTYMQASLTKNTAAEYNTMIDNVAALYDIHPAPAPTSTPAASSASSAASNEIVIRLKVDKPVTVETFSEFETYINIHIWIICALTTAALLCACVVYKKQFTRLLRK